jgi:ubiquinone/menaquinone biosynthesis C-methylase UbiE
MTDLQYHLSSDKILGKVVEIFKRKFNSSSSGRILDIGSGNGTLVKLLNRLSPNLKPNCVDYTDTLLTDKSIPLNVVDLNIQTLPFEDNSFDFISCTEVIEHLENYRLVIREAFRVAKPNSLVVFTTPNVLNLNSRLRYLQFGFHSLFGPIDVNREESFSTGGHITPVQYFYLAHSLVEAGFTDIKVEYDKRQSSSYFWMVVLFPIISVMGFFTTRRERRKKTINSTNDYLVAPINTIDMLLGRTIVVSAIKN